MLRPCMLPLLPDRLQPRAELPPLPTAVPPVQHVHHSGSVHRVLRLAGAAALPGGQPRLCSRSHAVSAVWGVSGDGCGRSVLQKGVLAC